MNEAFTLIELMIVVAIIAIIAAIAIPNLLESKKAANEAAAVANLRTINTTEELYHNRYGAYTPLSFLAGKNMIDQVLGYADISGKQGYTYTMTIGSGNQSWCCQCVPTTWGTTGELGYLIDNTGQIWEKTGAGSWEFKR